MANEGTGTGPRKQRRGRYDWLAELLVFAVALVVIYFAVKV